MPLYVPMDRTPGIVDVCGVANVSAAVGRAGRLASAAPKPQDC